jgi:hypothetical protein
MNSKTNYKFVIIRVEKYPNEFKRYVLLAVNKKPENRMCMFPPGLILWLDVEAIFRLEDA